MGDSIMNTKYCDNLFNKDKKFTKFNYNSKGELDRDKLFDSQASNSELSKLF